MNVCCSVQCGECLRCESRAGPPLDETVRLLVPLASTLEKLNLGGNKLGGTITDDIATFTKLTQLTLNEMSLDGEFPFGTVTAQQRAEYGEQERFSTTRGA